MRELQHFLNFQTMDFDPPVEIHCDFTFHRGGDLTVYCEDAGIDTEYRWYYRNSPRRIYLYEYTLAARRTSFWDIIECTRNRQVWEFEVLGFNNIVTAKYERFLKRSK